MSKQPPLRLARKSSDEAELITVTEAMRLVPGLTARRVYFWVSSGELEAFRTRFTAYTLYARARIEELASSESVVPSPVAPKRGHEERRRLSR